MTPTDHDIAEVAKKLTEAERAIVLRGSDRGKPAFMFRDDHDGRKASALIRKTKLFDGKMGGAQVLLWSLTSPGLRVKAYLESNNAG